MEDGFVVRTKLASLGSCLCRQYVLNFNLLNLCYFQHKGILKELEMKRNAVLSWRAVNLTLRVSLSYTIEKPQMQ